MPEPIDLNPSVSAAGPRRGETMWRGAGDRSFPDTGPVGVKPAVSRSVDEEVCSWGGEGGGGSAAPWPPAPTPGCSCRDRTKGEAGQDADLGGRR